MSFAHFPGVRWGPVALLFALPVAVPGETAAAGPAAGKYWVYVGTYTERGSKGIYRFDFDPATGTLTSRAAVGEVKNPSFLAITPDRRFLYAVSEVGDVDGKPTGAVTGFAINPKTGDLTKLNHQPTKGAGPCHVITDRAGTHVLAANYSGGSAVVLAIGLDGRLGPATGFQQHHGHSVNPQRQEGPHAHSINLDLANRFAVVADLGLDKVMIYRYDTAKGTLTPNDPPFVAVAPGSGPRHFAFHPNNKNAYVINEMASTITAFAYDPQRGAFETLQTVSTLPKGFKGENTTAEVQVHPSGRFVYGSNRGHNSIAVFQVDPATGKLTAAGHQDHQIKTPRNFGIDPTGTFCLVANMDSDSIVVFRIDPKTGALAPTGNVAEVPIPVCVKFIPAGR